MCELRSHYHLSTTLPLPYHRPHCLPLFHIILLICAELKAKPSTSHTVCTVCIGRYLSMRVWVAFVCWFFRSPILCGATRTFSWKIFYCSVAQLSYLYLESESGNVCVCVLFTQWTEWMVLCAQARSSQVCKQYTIVNVPFFLVFILVFVLRCENEDSDDEEDVCIASEIRWWKMARRARVKMKMKTTNEMKRTKWEATATRIWLHKNKCLH